MLAILLTAAAFATSVLSGVFGMAGGMVLMGLYAAVLPIPAAMVLHGVTQLTANGARAVLLRRAIRWRTLGWYGLGLCASLAAFAWAAVEVDRPTLLVLLGAIPIAMALLPPLPALDVTRPRAAVLCGVVVTAAQLTAGASGPLLDVFFVRSDLDRYAVIATKAFTQSVGHLTKLLYFAALLDSAPADLPSWLFPASVAAAVLGTRAGKALLERFSEAAFRRWSARLVLGLGAVYVLEGLRAL